MLTSRDFTSGFRKLGVDPAYPVIVHAMLPVFGEIEGGVDTVLQALLAAFDTMIMPVFTTKTMVIPEVGPPENGLVYGSGKATNYQAEVYYADMPADKKMGVLAEVFRSHPRAYRSTHPILSFAGVHARAILDAQLLHDPLLPIQKLIDDEGWVLMVGASHTVNCSIHYAEKLSGRKQFIRWALTDTGVTACWGFPGCADGFDAVSPRLGGVKSSVRVGEAEIQAFPLVSLMDIVCGMIKADPLALLCERTDCVRCNDVRASVAQSQARQST